VRQNVLAAGELDDDDDDEGQGQGRAVPPGAAASWANNVDNIDSQQPTTDKPTDVVVVTSPV